MSIAKQVVCIFPHSDEEFESYVKLLDYLKDDLPKEQQGKYYLRGLGRTRRFMGQSFGEAVIKNSLTLLRKQDRVWGAAYVQQSIEEIENSEPYKFTIDFYPETIKTYDDGIAIQDIQSVTGCDLTTGWLKASYLVLGYSDIVEKQLMRIMDLPLKPH